MTMSDPLDKLLRDAAGATPDPGPSRHFIRAGLAPELARRRRGERRARVRLTLAMAAALLVIMCGQLGSEDFVTTSETRVLNGRHYQVYKQGMGGQEMLLREPGSSSDGQERRGADWKVPEAALDAQKKLATEWLTMQAAHEGTMVHVEGYVLGNEQWYTVATDFEIGGKMSSEGRAADGYPEDMPRRLANILYANKGANGKQLMGIRHSRKPDFTIQMTINGLVWDMDAWRIKFPGQTEIIYYAGLRHDGVRSKDGESY
jgi:hypothetical protein